VSVRKRGGDSEGRLGDDPLIRKLDALFDSVVAGWKVKGEYSTVGELSEPELRTLTLSHILRLIDKFFTKYGGVKDKLVVAYLYTGSFKLMRNNPDYVRDLPSVPLGDVIIHDLSRYNDNVVKATGFYFIASIEKETFEIGIINGSKQLNAPNLFHIRLRPKSWVVYLNYPTRFFKTANDAASNVLKAITLSLGFIDIVTDRKADRRVFGIIPSRTSATTAIRMRGGRFGVVRVPQHAETFFKNDKNAFLHSKDLRRFALLVNSLA
jgi:hypothetical protein